MKSAENTIGAESPALGVKAFYHFNSLTGKIVGYVPYKSTSHWIRLVAEQAIVAISYYIFKMSRTGKFMTKY